jgi:predicted RNA-binding Zn ribbon-like protein
MSAESPSPAPFDLCGGHPALDFVNSLDQRFSTGGPVELLIDYEQLLRFATESGLLSVRQARALAHSSATAAGARAVHAARELREALAAALYAAVDGRAPPSAGLRVLEARCREASDHRELCWQATGSAAARPRARWEWGRSESAAELPLWMLALAACELLASADLDRVRACGSETCRWLFLDTSKNHTRRWCNMKVCGNRMKARRFQARRARRRRARRLRA